MRVLAPPSKYTRRFNHVVRHLLDFSVIDAVFEALFRLLLILYLLLFHIGWSGVFELPRGLQVILNRSKFKVIKFSVFRDSFAQQREEALLEVITYKILLCEVAPLDIRPPIAHLL